jgi:hypothetical protein
MASDINLKELASEVNVLQSIPPLLRLVTVTGAEIGVAGYGSVLFITNIGAFTDGTFTLEIQEASESGGSFTAVDSDDLFGTGLTTAALKEPAWTSANANSVHAVAYIGKQPFVKAVITRSGGSTGANMGQVAVRSHARHQPAGATQAP